MENSQTNKTVEAAEATIDSIKKLMDAIGNDCELKHKLEDTLAALNGKKSEFQDAKALEREEQEKGVNPANGRKDDDSSEMELSDIFNEDAIAGMVVGFVAGAAVVSGGVLIHKLFNK